MPHGTCGKPKNIKNNQKFALCKLFTPLPAARSQRGFLFISTMQNEQVKKIVSGAFFTDADINTDLQQSCVIGGKTVASPGNFITISGAAKARKTTFCFGAIASFFLGQPVYNMQLIGDSKNDLLVHIDTESSKYSFSKQCTYFKKKLKANKLPSNFLPFLFREYQPAQIIESINFIVDARKPKFLIIDNLTDLAVNINDPEETARLIGWLKKLTKENNITLICLLHTGKNNGLTLGWLGSYSDRAAQSTLLVRKDPNTDQSILEPTLMRDDRGFEPVCIEWSEDIKDYVTTMSPEQPQIKKGKFSIDNYEPKFLINACETIFQNEATQKYEAVISQIKNIFAIGTNIAKQNVLPYLIGHNYIINHEGNYRLKPIKKNN